MAARLTLTALAIVAGALLMACGGSASAAAPRPTTVAVECPPTCTSSTDQPNEATPATPAPTETPIATPLPTATPTPVPTATPVPAPPATPAPAGPSQHDLTVAYQAMTQRNARTSGDALGAMGTACQSGDLQRCRSAMARAREAVTKYQSDIDATQAPSCLTYANAEMRTALGNFHDGLNSGISGVDNYDPSLISDGSDLIKLGNDHLESASLLIKQASC